MSHPAAAVSEWITMLDHIDASIAGAIEAAERRRQSTVSDEEFVRDFDESALGEIDDRLRGFEDRLSHVRALADQIEATLESDEQAVIEFRETTTAARQRPAPSRQL